MVVLGERTGLGCEHAPPPPQPRTPSPLPRTLLLPCHLSPPLLPCRLEATYEIREDVADVLQRVGGYTDDVDGKVRFAGWSRMGIPLTGFKIIEVRGGSRADWAGGGRRRWKGYLI